MAEVLGERLVTHVLSDADGLDPVAVVECRETIRELAGCRHEVVLLGGTRSGSALADLDLPATTRIAWSRHGARTIASRLAEACLADGRPRRIVCWDGASMRTARDAQLASATLIADVPLASVPPINGNAAEARSEAREALGIGPDDLVLAGVSGRADGGDGWAFVYAVVLTTLALDKPIVGIVSARAWRLDRGLFGYERSQIGSRVVVVERATERYLPAADVGVCMPGGRPRADSRAVAAAHHTGIPVCVPAGALPAELHPSRLGELCLSRFGEAPDQVSRIVMLFQDAELRREAARLARATHDEAGFALRSRDAAPGCVNRREPLTDRA